jgi:sugar lactone lactonase YvrE
MRTAALFLASAMFLIAPVSTRAGNLTEVARSPKYAWSGVAVSRAGRIFVEFPRFQDQKGNPSIAEILPDGTLKPYPGGEWSQWAPGEPIGNAFVSTNTMHIFDQDPDSLWVIDTAAPFQRKALAGGPKVVKIDLRTNSVARVYPLGRDAVPENGYLNDIRLGKGVAYLTESGTGAILVLDLKTGNVRRLLSNSAVTKADPRRIPVAEGSEMRKLSGEVLRVNADAIELSPDGRWLYFAPVDGPLRRVKTADLRNPKLSEEELARRVEIYADIPTIGGSAMDRKGNIYLSDVTHSQISVLTPDRKIRTLVQDRRLIWPDALFLAPDGYLYIPAAQIDRMPFLKSALPLQPPYRLFRYSVTINPS